MTTPLVERMRGFGTTIFAEMSALAAQHRRDQPGPGLSRHRRALARCSRRPVAAIDGGRNQYPPGPGVPELLEAVAAHQRRFYGLTVDPRSQVLVTAGATEAIAAVVLALCEPGDEVVTFEPYYDSYAATIALAGAVRRTSVLRFPDFAVDEASLRAAFSVADPAGAAQHPAQPDRQGVLAGRAGAGLRAGAGARRVGGHRRGLRAPDLRRRASTCRWRPCRGCGSAPSRSRRRARRSRPPGGRSAG